MTSVSPSKTRTRWASHRTRTRWPEQGERHRIEGAGHFDVPIGVDRALAAGEERKRLAGKRVERPLLDLDKVRPDLAPRGAVDAQPRDRAIPVPQKRILRVEAVEAAAFERIVFDVAAAALLLPVFLRAARLRGQRGEAPVRGEREIDVMAIGIEETRAHDGRFEIVVRTTVGTPPRSRKARSCSRRNVSSF